MKTEISNPTGLIYVTVPHTMPPKAYAFCTPADFSDWLKSVNKRVDATTYDRSEWIARAEEAGEEEGSDWWNRWVAPGLTLFDAGSEKITEVWYSETRNELFDAADAPTLNQAILESIDDFNTWTVLDRTGAIKVAESGWPQPHKSIETTGEVAKACQQLGWI
jgi:hypothetical protein